ncbi:MAG: molecular chaperone TorD family protein [Betaproteobacteria bacterium]|jgi:TorA maturation chaperone TorD|nr:molecular chaperone TorD family protein [Betaproteobacteria bacterium]
MNAQSATPELDAAVSQEDRARADFYALISRLFYAGPDAGLLAAIAGADEIASEAEDNSLALAWRSLISAAAAMDAEAAQKEYDSVFVGTGKAEITPYAAQYLSEVMKENVLVRLRAELAEIGLERKPGTAEYEDHFSGLCEVMRHLIFFAPNGAVQKQKSFFLRYLVPCYAIVCNAVAASPNTNFYKYVARFTKAFLDVEAKSLEMI